MNTEKRTMIDFELIWKTINHTTTKEEDNLLAQWLEEDPEHEVYFENACQYFKKGSVFKGKKSDIEKAWSILKKKEVVSYNRHLGWIISASAIAVVGIFLIFTFLIPTRKPEVNQLAKNIKIDQIKPGTNKAILILDDGSVLDLSNAKNLLLNEGGSVIKSEGAKLKYTEKQVANQEVKYNTLKIPRGGEFFLQLADGTKVWLNSETTLRYPVQFVGNERKVELSGEAYFEVAHNAKIPFLVESGEQVIKVLGTEFNISSYTENSSIYTTLVNGSVEVFRKDKPEISQNLAPNEQSSLAKNDASILIRKVNPYQYIAWKDGRFVFEDQNLGEIMKTLSKWYDIDVVFAHEDLQNIRFTGNLPRYSDFDTVLKKIQKTNEVAFEIENKKITIK